MCHRTVHRGCTRLSRQNSRKVSIEIGKVFFEAYPAQITIRTVQHVLTLTATISGCKMAESVHVNVGAVIRLLHATHIYEFHATPLFPAQLSIIRSKQPQQGKMRASKNVEQTYRLARMAPSPGYPALYRPPSPSDPHLRNSG